MRRFCSGSARVGILQVFRLEAAPRPAEAIARPRLLFPTGLPSPAEAAAALSAASARGEPVFITEHVLGQLLGSEGSGMALAESGPSAGPPTLAEGGGSKDALAAPLEAAAAGTAALVAGGQSIPLTHALAADAAAAEPDWVATRQPTADDADTVLPPAGAARELLTAAAEGDAARLRSLLSADAGGGAAPAAAALLSSARLPPSGASALHLAAAAGAESAVELLLARGAPVRATAANGSTALHWAALSGHAGVVKALLHAGAPTDARTSTWCATVRGEDTGQTAAHWAASAGHGESLAALLEAGPHALMMRDERQLTPSGLAAKEGYTGLVRRLDELEGSRVVCVGVRMELSAQSADRGGREAEAGAEPGGREPGKALLD